MLFDGAPLANTPSVNLDNTNIVNSAGQTYVPAGAGSGTGGSPTLDVDYTDAIAMLNSPFANTAVFDNSDLDGFDDVTGDPSLFEDMLLQGADTRIGLNEAANALPSSTIDGGAGNDVLEGPPASLDIIPTTYTTAMDLMGVGKTFIWRNFRW